MGTVYRRAAGPTHPPRPHRGDDRRGLPPQVQASESRSGRRGPAGRHSAYVGPDLIFPHTSLTAGSQRLFALQRGHRPPARVVRDVAGLDASIGQGHEEHGGVWLRRRQRYPERLQSRRLRWATRACTDRIRLYVAADSSGQGMVTDPFCGFGATEIVRRRWCENIP